MRKPDRECICVERTESARLFVSGKERNNLCNRIRESQKRASYGVAIGHSGFCARYRRKEFNIVVIPPLSESADLGFLIHAQGPIAQVRVRDEIFDRGVCLPESYRAGAQFDQPMVLAHDIEVVEIPEKFVPSLIRIQRFDFSALDIRKGIYEFAALVVPAGESLSACRNRKVHMGEICYATPFCESHGEHVEGRSGGVDVSAEFDAEGARKRLLKERYYPIVCGWRWRILDTDVQVDAGPGFDPLIEGYRLGYGPIYGGISV